MLRSLSVKDNSLSGARPDNLASKKMLQIVALNSNRLSGVIPNAIVSVNLLDLHRDRLSASIPDAIARLIALLVGFNVLVGHIPDSASSWTEMIDLSLESNELSGAINHLCSSSRPVAGLGCPRGSLGSWSASGVVCPPVRGPHLSLPFMVHITSKMGTAAVSLL